MDSTQRIFKLADLAGVTKKIRQYNRYTENFPIPTVESELDKLLIDMVRDYLTCALPGCEIKATALDFVITFPNDLIEQISFLEKALNIYHYASPSLANYISNLSYAISNFDRGNDSTVIKIKKDMRKMHQSPSRNFVMALDSIQELAIFLSNFSEVYNEHYTKINTFVVFSEKKKARLQALRNDVANKKKPYDAIRAQADRNKAQLQLSLDNILQKKAEEPEIIGDIAVGTKVRVIKVPHHAKGYIWCIYPLSPAVIPDKAVVISEEEKIEKIIKNNDQLFYLTSSSHICSYNEDYWNYGINSAPSDKLYYDPATGIFSVKTDNGEEFFFDTFLIACEFITASGLKIDTANVLVRDVDAVSSIKTFVLGGE